MKFQFVYLLAGLLLCIGCSNRVSQKENLNTESYSEIASEPLADRSSISEEDAYKILIKQKLKELIDQKALLDSHPQFEVDSNVLLPVSKVKDTSIQAIDFIELFKTLSDSVKYVKTKVVYPNMIDTLITYINTSEKLIEGEKFKITNISFIPAKPDNKVSEEKLTPRWVEKFSSKDLSFTWEEINACDCIFMVRTENAVYKEIYFGRFKNNTTGILQLGKNTQKYIIPISKPRALSRTPGTSWNETYQNENFKVILKSTSSENIVKGKFTYSIRFKLNHKDTNTTVDELVLANCKS